MLDTAFFMTMGGLGVSLAGFGGLFSALHDGATVTPDVLHPRSRGIAYTRSPFAYLFRRRTIGPE